MENEFMKCKDSDQFRNQFITFIKQRLALKQGLSYFEFYGTWADEKFDNEIRLMFLKKNNKKFKRMYDLGKLENLAYHEFKQNLKDNEKLKS